MAFNGVGVYIPPVPPDFPAVTGQTIQASHYNTVVNDIATALTKCVTRDGQTPIQANLPMTGFKHTGVANAVANDEYVALGQSTAALAAGLAAQLRNKNHIINGNFDVWQRGTSQTTSGYGSVDRWTNLHLGSTKTISRQAFTLGQTNVPGEPAYYSRTGVSSSAGAGNYVVQQQRIESVRTLAGQTCTVSFWAKADASRNIAIEFGQNFGTGGSPSAQVTAIGSQLVALTTTWTKYTKTIAIPSISGKTLGTAGDDSLEFTFWFDAGSNWNTRTASLGQQSGTFDIAQVQIEAGSVASDFEVRSLVEELALCQRYYETCGFIATADTPPYTSVRYTTIKRAIPASLTVLVGTISPATLNARGSTDFFSMDGTATLNAAVRVAVNSEL